MGKKTVNYNESGIDKLPDDKPVLYRIQTQNKRLNYAGIAKRGRVHERIKEHLGDIPGAKVQIEQFGRINDAQEKEARVIKRNKPKYNKQGR